MSGALRSLRDYLRDYPASARRLQRLKRGLALRHSAGDFASREAYTEAKTAFVLDMTERALARGYPRGF